MPRFQRPHHTGGYGRQRADPSLLEGLRDRLADNYTLLVAGMGRFLGADGQAFALDQRTLAKVVGLSGQQAASDLVHALLKFRLLDVAERAGYTAKKSTVYRWVGPGAVEPRPAVEDAQTVAGRAKAPSPPPGVSVASPPTKPVKEAPTRPGQSWTASKTHPCQSLAFQGGFVAPNVHFAEMMLKRKLEKDGRTVPMRFWEDDELGQMYQPQLVAARDLLKDHLPEALSAALRAPEGKTVYSLRAPWMAPIYKREDTRIRQEKANLAEKAMGSAAAPPSPPGLQAPRSGFIPTNRSLLSKLKSR